MSDINFLANKKNNSKKRSGKSKKQEIEWTTPDKDEFSRAKASEDKEFLKGKAVSYGNLAEKSGKFKFFDRFSFFKKNKENSGKPTDKESFKFSGEEALKPLNERAENEPAAARKDDGKKNKSHRFLFWRKKSQPIKKISKKEAKSIDKKKLNIENNEKKTTPAPLEKITEKEGKEKWEKAEILETNLVKGELASFFNWKKGVLVLVIYSALSGLIIAGFYSGLLFWEQQIKNSGSEESNRIRDLNEQVIKPLEKDAKKILAEQEKIKLADSILREHIYWTNFFKFLEDNTLAEVYYTSSFSGNTNGTYSFPARTKDFKTVLNQVNVMRMNDDVKKASVDGGSVASASEEQSGDVGGINFTLRLLINPGVFTK